MFRSLIVTSLLTAGVLARAADVAYAPPMGGMRFVISGGSPSAPVTTWFAIPLLDHPLAAGSTRGVITAVTATSITVSGANWTAGALASAAYPYALRIMSGAGEGATLGVTSNTTETLNLTGRDLIQLGVVAGDKFQLIPVDTLNSLFGADTFAGGTNADEADTIILSSSVQLSYYYNTSLGRWVRTTGPATDRSNTPIPLGSVMGVVRKAAGFDLRVVGDVPLTKANHLVSNAGSTYTHTGFPTNTTIGELAVQSRLPGWVSASSADSADLLIINSGGTWLNYFHNGSYWQRTTGPATNRDSIVIPAGTPIQFFKRGSATGSSTFTRQLPYTL